MSINIRNPSQRPPKSTHLHHESMENTLSFAFADLYMPYIEKNIFTTTDKAEIYTRYVGDIFVFIKIKRKLQTTNTIFEQNSTPKFTYKPIVHNNIPLLDVEIELKSIELTTYPYNKTH